jgi:hypothetical protein
VSIRVQCACGELIDARDRMAGREVRCPRCRRLVLVPGYGGPLRSSTVFGLAVLAGILITLGIVLLPGWFAQLRSGSAQAEHVCSGRLSKLYVAILAYANDHDGWMPSSWDNTFALIAPYLSPSDRSDTEGVWRCPIDPFGTDPANHCSYGVNADETDGDSDDHNRFHPGQLFRQSGRASPDGQTDWYPGPFAHRVAMGGSRQAPVRLQTLLETASNTILMVEQWSPFNRLDLMDARSPMRGGPGPRDRLSMAIREYGLWRRPRFDDRGWLLDAGSYLFLKPYEGRETPIERMYHGGRVHVLYANGQVALVPITALLSPPYAPPDATGRLLADTPWTRPERLLGGRRGG